MFVKLVPLVALFNMIVPSCYAQRIGPIVKTYAYEQEITPGIPGGRGGPPTSTVQLHGRRYLIYLETKDPSIVVDGVWMSGKYHDVETVIKTAPVIMSGPMQMEPDDKNTLVPATPYRVIEILVKDHASSKVPSGDVAQLLKNNAAVVQLTEKGKPISLSVASFQKKDPIYRP